MNESQVGRSSRRTVWFLLFQAIALPGLAFATFWGVSKSESRRLPDLLNVPRNIQPSFNDPAVVTDNQLQTALAKIRFQIPSSGVPKVNHVDHCLRMWGRQVAFSDTSSQCTFVDGEMMLAMLADDRVFQKYWGTQSRPFLMSRGKTTRLRTQEGVTSTSHVDHTLATLAEVGVPLSYEIRTRQQKTDLRGLVEGALARFSLNQAEYEWTAMLLALYANDNQPWVSREGQEITYDRLAQRIMRQEYGQGVCYGGHRLYTLTILRRVDSEQLRLFSDEMRLEIDDHLREATRRLIASQHIDGYWDRAWPGAPIYEKNALWEDGRRLLATGHALEWWAMGNENVLPPRETIVRAGQWLAREIEAMDEAKVQKNLTFLTHAGRALALWRGDTPDRLFSDATWNERKQTK